MDYQAEAFAYIGVHALVDHPLDWYDDLRIIPASVRMESGGPGDDLKITNQDGSIIEIQAKAGLKKGIDFWNAVESLFKGLLNDKDLRGVLLVDNRASGTIKHELRCDLLRLSDGQVDDLKRITCELLEKLHSLGVTNESNEIFKRFRIIALDLEPASGGRSAARALLSRIIAEPDRCGEAWVAIVDQGHDLISRRGQKSTSDLARIIGRNFKLKSESDRLDLVLDKFRNFTERANAEFIVPGLDVRLSIEKDWVNYQLSPVDDHFYSTEQSFTEQLEYYFKTNATKHEAEIAGEWIVEHDHRPVIVLGGAGAGKSTLTKKIANAYSKRGKLCARVSLANVCRIVGQGDSFENAIAKVMSDGSGISLSHSLIILGRLDVLVADGLDECDPHRHMIAESLFKWSIAHQNCAIVVTSRPVGHSRSLLPNFRHYEIPNFDDNQVRKLSETLHCAAIKNPNRQRELIERFEETLSKSRWATPDLERELRGIRELSARNPLFLGFLVRLNCDDQPLTGHSVKLYEHVVKSAETAQVNDRYPPTPVSSSVVNKILDLLGRLICQFGNLMTEDLVDRAASKLEHTEKLTKIQAVELVELVAQFWETRRVLEKLSSGHRSTVVFIHPSMMEFATARSIVRMSNAEITDFLRACANSSSMRHAIELASTMAGGERVVNLLLELDDYSNPGSTEIIVASNCMMESEGISPALIERIVDSLTLRLFSPIPLVAIEAASAFFPIAKFAPEKIKALFQRLDTIEYPWTQLGILSLSMAINDNELSPKAFRIWIEKFSRTHVSIGGWLSKGWQAELTDQFPAEETYKLQELTTAAGFRSITDTAEPSELEAMVNGGAFDAVSVKIQVNIQSILEQSRLRHLSPLRSKNRRHDHGQLSLVNQGSKQAIKGFRCFLEAMTHLGTVDETRRFTIPLPALSAVFEAFDFWRMTRHPMIGFPTESDTVVDSMLLAVAQASGLNTDDLASEAKHALALISDDESKVFWNVAERMPVQFEWSRISKRFLTKEFLGRALVHHWKPLRYFASNLLTNCTHGDDNALVAESAFQSANDDDLDFLAEVVRQVCSDRAVDIFNERLLRPLTPKCGMVFKQLLLKLAGSELPQQTISIAFRGVLDDDPEVAVKFAHQICTDERFIGEHISSLKAAANHWKQRGGWCNQHNKSVFKDVCDDCVATSGVATVLPNPRPILTEFLCNSDAYTRQELFALLEDQQRAVRDLAISKLSIDSTTDDDLFRKILSGTLAGGLPVSLIKSCLSLVVSPLLEDAISQLTESELTCLRRLAADSLGKMSIDKAKPLAAKLLIDKSPQCRTAAARWFRKFTNANRQSEKEKIGACEIAASRKEYPQR